MVETRHRGIQMNKVIILSTTILIYGTLRKTNLGASAKPVVIHMTKRLYMHAMSVGPSQRERESQSQLLDLNTLAREVAGLGSGGEQRMA